MKLKEINSQIPLQNEPSVDPLQNEITENNQEISEHREEQPTQEEPIIRFHPIVVNSHIVLGSCLSLNMQETWLICFGQTESRMKI